MQLLLFLFQTTFSDDLFLNVSVCETMLIIVDPCCLRNSNQFYEHTKAKTSDRCCFPIYCEIYCEMFP